MTTPPDPPLPPRLKSSTIILPLGLMVLLMPPLIGIVAAQKITVFGAPWITVYIFGLWLLGIVACFLLSRRLRRHHAVDGKPDD